MSELKIKRYEEIWVRCQYTPRGKTGTPLCTSLNFIGKLLRPAIEEGRYVVRIGAHAYAVQIQDMFEIED